MYYFYRGRANKPFLLPDGETVILRPMTYYLLPANAVTRSTVGLSTVGPPRGGFVDLSSHIGTSTRRTARTMPVVSAPKKMGKGLAFGTAVTIKPVGKIGGPLDNAPVPIKIDEPKGDVDAKKAAKAAEKRDKATVPAIEPEPEPEVETQEQAVPEQESKQEPEVDKKVKPKPKKHKAAPKK